jgi:hypothetical protein
LQKIREAEDVFQYMKQNGIWFTELYLLWEPKEMAIIAPQVDMNEVKKVFS